MHHDFVWQLLHQDFVWHLVRDMELYHRFAQYMNVYIDIHWIT